MFLCTGYHVLHIGGRGVDLTAQLVVQVQNQVHVSLTDRPLSPRPHPPPLLILVPVVVQDGLKSCGVSDDHGQDGLAKTQEQPHCSNTAWDRKKGLHSGRKYLTGSDGSLTAGKKKIHVNVSNRWIQSILFSTVYTNKFMKWFLKLKFDICHLCDSWS